MRDLEDLSLNIKVSDGYSWISDGTPLLSFIIFILLVKHIRIGCLDLRGPRRTSVANSIQTILKDVLTFLIGNCSSWVAFIFLVLIAGPLHSCVMCYFVVF